MSGFRTRGAVVILLMLAWASTARAQPTPWLWGAWATGSLAAPSERFDGVPGVGTCRSVESEFESDGGGMFGLGAEAGWREPGSVLELSVRLGLAFGSAAFVAEERAGLVATPSGALQDLLVGYRSTIDRTELRLEPVVRWHPMSPIHISAGIIGALPLSMKYDQRERLVAPQGATYLDGSGERVEGGGRLDGSPWLGVTAGIGVDLDIGGRTLLRPELGGVLAVTRPVEAIDWKPHELRAGLSVLFGAIGRESTPVTPR